MKIRATIAVAALGLALAAPSVFAQNSQQSKMKTCSTQNAGKKGDDYKSAMKTCLSSSPAAAPAPATQQEKMTACSKANKGKKGDDYKSSMKSCLSSKS
jgi:hypothetical protein